MYYRGVLQYYKYSLTSQTKQSKTRFGNSKHCPPPLTTPLKNLDIQSACTIQLYNNLSNQSMVISNVSIACIKCMLCTNLDDKSKIEIVSNESRYSINSGYSFIYLLPTINYCCVQYSCEISKYSIYGRNSF